MRAAVWKRSIRVAVAIATVVAIGAASAPAGVSAGGKRELKVMTQNLYLGSSLLPALTAQTPDAFLRGVAEIYGTVNATRFPLRAAAIAETVAAERPDIIGLQEASIWTAARTDGGTALPSYDFLDLLQKALQAEGLEYEVAAVSNNADIGPVPLVGLFGCLTLVSCSVRLQDRDVILVDAYADDLTWSNPKAGNFVAQQLAPLPLPDTEPLSFNRGWASIDATLDGAKFRFVVSHLEVAGFAEVQEAQAKELVTGPALRTLRPVVLVGDFNSAADFSSTRSYAILLKALFADAWWTTHGRSGDTCCQNPTLTNPVSELDERIDLVLVRLALPTSAKVVGDLPIGPPPPFWASDHAGVVATVRFL